MVRHGWQVTGHRLVRELLMRAFDEAMWMAERMARIIVANPHHAGITEAERRLAAKADAVVG